MKDIITLLIPTHNRHNYLERAIAYYGPMPIQIYIVDSSATPYDIKQDNITYIHLPTHTLTGKISHALNLITTPYVVMSADDDFLLPEKVQTCIDFLDKHPSYQSAAGNSICYKRDTVSSTQVNFAPIYTDRLSYEVTDKDPFARIKSFFNPYRGAFYAVHRTAVLRKAFEGAADVVKNLYMNEYLTGIYTIASGGFIELPILYHVRDYADDSGDKTTPNLDAIFHDTDLNKQYNGLIEQQAALVAEVAQTEVAFASFQLHGILDDVAMQMQQGRYAPRASADKKYGKMIQKIPLFGNLLIKLYRNYRAKQALQPFIRTAEDQRNLDMLRKLIISYKHIL
jgi:glycosyltransferase domain-containing protein